MGLTAFASAALPTLTLGLINPDDHILNPGGNFFQEERVGGEPVRSTSYPGVDPQFAGLYNQAVADMHYATTSGAPNFASQFQATNPDLNYANSLAFNAVSNQGAIPQLIAQGQNLVAQGANTSRNLQQQLSTQWIDNMIARGGLNPAAINPGDASFFRSLQNGGGGAGGSTDFSKFANLSGGTAQGFLQGLIAGANKSFGPTEIAHRSFLDSLVKNQSIGDTRIAGQKFLDSILNAKITSSVKDNPFIKEMMSGKVNTDTFTPLMDMIENRGLRQYQTSVLPTLRADVGAAGAQNSSKAGQAFALAAGDLQRSILDQEQKFMAQAASEALQDRRTAGQLYETGRQFDVSALNQLRGLGIDATRIMEGGRQFNISAKQAQQRLGLESASLIERGRQFNINARQQQQQIGLSASGQLEGQRQFNIGTQLQARQAQESARQANLNARLRAAAEAEAMRQFNVTMANNSLNRALSGAASQQDAWLAANQQQLSTLGQLPAMADMALMPYEVMRQVGTDQLNRNNALISAQSQQYQTDLANRLNWMNTITGQTTNSTSPVQYLPSDFQNLLQMAGGAAAMYGMARGGGG